MCNRSAKPVALTGCVDNNAATVALYKRTIRRTHFNFLGPLDLAGTYLHHVLTSSIIRQFDLYVNVFIGDLTFYHSCVKRTLFSDKVRAL